MPYPRDERLQPGMSTGRVVVTVGVSLVTGGVLGGLIGFLMGTFIPNFYRSGMFGGGETTDPIATGTGLGISEGLGLGFLLGVLIVCVQAFGKRKAS